MKKKQFKMTRRQVLKAGLIGGAGLMMPLRFFPRKAFGEPLMAGLSDPAIQPKFLNPVPDALAPGFIYKPRGGKYNVKVAKATQSTGLVDSMGKRLRTPVWGYGDPRDGIITWPGRTFQVKSVSAGGRPETEVNWENGLNPVDSHLLPVDTNLHWCYSLHGYDSFTIENNGVPIITHLHGGHTDFQFDGNPEFFYGPAGNRGRVVGPQWDYVPGGFTTNFLYDNDVPAGNLWYHDHALGITRLNVYAGLAGFYFVRDEFDTGKKNNPLGLPAWPYEKAYAIQDRMFRDDGQLFYPAFPGDPAYADFITGEGVVLHDLTGDPFPENPNDFPDVNNPWNGGGPTALAEFFGDHMVVNGVIWPFENVEPRNYRLHLLNGTDSRFMGVRFRAVPAGEIDFTNASEPLDFTVIGSDQGLAKEATITNLLLFEPGSRYDIVFDFKGLKGQRVIMENIGGDAPFGGDLFDPIDLGPGGIAAAVEAGDLFEDRQTDRIMAFDVANIADQDGVFDDSVIDFGPEIGPPTVSNSPRKVALFEGVDEFGRLQPLLGVVNETEDPVTGIATPKTWFEVTTETPALGTTEEWEIYNFTGDAHPVHLHLVNFEILGRNTITFHSDEGDPGQPVFQHNYTEGRAPIITNLSVGGSADKTPADGYVENAPKDMVTALPGEVTMIKATFDKPGRYVWHCHILSHEDHEMMRVLHVGPGA